MFTKKVEHCLFVEEETYNWAPDYSTASKKAILIMGLFMLGAVVALTQMR